MQRRSVLRYLGLTAGACLEAKAWPLPTPVQAAVIPSSRAVTPSTKAVFCNQVGYLPSQAKVATVRGVDPGQVELLVRSVADQRVVFNAALSGPRTDALSGDLVRQADFSSVRQPGEYRLEAGDTRSEVFSIRDDVYATTLRTTVRAYTGQRCGCPVDLGGGYRHPSCHPAGNYGTSSGKTGSLPNGGGWHDAGDYGRYIVNSGITCGTLLWAWEMYPEALRLLHLDLPQIGSAAQDKLPDYLEEILWNLKWMLQLQDSDGGVFHKQTSEHFCAFILPQDDTLVSEVVGTGVAPYKSTCATADFAAVMAIAARCYAEFDQALALRFRTAAQQAWQWANAHPDVPFDNPRGITSGSYADPHTGDELAWASAELWRTTGEPQYEKAFLRSLTENLDELTIGVPSWSNVGSMACWTYAMAARAGHRTVSDAVQRATRVAAQSLISQSGTNGFGNTMAASDYTWGSNGTACNQSLLLLVAHRFQSNPEAVTAALNNLHYVLGRNCFSISWVTQVGHNPFLHPHHRPSAADGIAAPWPGLLSGGPNRHPGDAVARKLPQLAPMRMWVDDEGAYSLNEIAINWNAPLVFLLSFANTRG